MRKGLLVALIAMLALSLSAAGVYFVWHPTPTQVVDRLCEYVHAQQMDCVAVLATDDFVKPGSIIDYRPNAQAKGPDKTPLPNSDLFGDACLVPGVMPANFKRELESPRPIAIPTLVYETNKGLDVGADVDLPQFEGVKLTAGPKWKNISKVELSVDQAWVSQLDENEAIRALQSCEVRKACVDHILSQQYSVIGTTIVAKGIALKAFSSEGGLIAGGGSISNQSLNLSIGGRSDLSSTSDSTLKSSSANVVAVRLFPASIFSNLPVCSETALFTPDGSAKVDVSGGGGKGHIGNQSAIRPLGELAKLELQGAERSECNSGFERANSGASAAGIVSAPSPDTLKLEYDLTAQGGHYVTTTACLAGQVIGKTGHDTSAVASADLRGTILALIRSEGDSVLSVRFGGAPDGTAIRAVDWSNEPLRGLKEEVIQDKAGVSVSGSGVLQFLVGGPGVYRIETSMRVTHAVEGSAGNGQAKAAATVSVSVE